MKGIHRIKKERIDIQRIIIDKKGVYVMRERYNRPTQNKQKIE